MSSSAANQAPPSTSRRFRLALRFSLRTFLVAVTIFCIALGWQLHRAKLQRDAVAAIRDTGGSLYYDYQRHDWQSDWDKFDATARPWEPAWLLVLVGIDFFHNVTDVSVGFRRGDQPPANIASHLAHFPRLRSLSISGLCLDDEGLRTVGRLKRLEFLFRLPGGSISDDGVANLRDMPRLKCVDFRLAELGDRSLQSFARLPNLEFLNVSGNDFTDAGLAALAGHPQLKRLHIGGAQKMSSISDAGIVHLAQSPQLEELGLALTRVTPAGLKPLQKLPNLRTLSLHGSPADDYAAVAPLFPNVGILCNTAVAPLPNLGTSAAAIGSP